ncbi:MAG: type II toxin-antitoxin system death-on-curing family toxin [Parachlamydiaceae bacterium]
MIFLMVEQVIDFHTEIINDLGGAHGIREMGLLISAIEMPKASMFGEFLHVSIYEKAAAYLYHIVCNHPFVDGNKRSGLVAALTFLEVNGVILEFDENELEELVVKVAEGNAEKHVIADFFHKNHPMSKD